MNPKGPILAFRTELAPRVWAVLLFLPLALLTHFPPGVAQDQKTQNVSKLPQDLSRLIDFNKDVRPIFEANCYKCHGPDKQKSGFRLDQKASALKGGDRSAAILPGKSAESPLVQFVAGLVEDMQMPPPKEAKRLSLEQISVLRAWIDQGASWPNDGTPELNKSKADFWSFRPASRPRPPAGCKLPWGRNEIDQFILARLEKESLHPAPEADKRTLVRRVYFDLTGLPPTPEQVREYMQDTDEDAYERMVDRVLNSPSYGERWARHWLDTVHYGETQGYDKDKPRTNAWPYRDYIIRSLNQDKSYSRFVQEQLAGDVLYPDDPDGVVALGFIAAGPWDFVGHVELPESKTDGLIARYNDRDDMVMTTMSTFQSLTVHCARCHDHKFDPISQEDYYSLQAVFAGIDRADRWFDSDPAVFTQRKHLLTEKKEWLAKRKALDETIARLSPELLKLVDIRVGDLKKELVQLKKANSAESPSNGFHSEISPTAEATKWVQIDLGKAMALDDIHLVPARPTDFADTPGFGFPRRFRVEISDRDTFEMPATIWDRTEIDFPNPGDDAVIIPVKGKQARIVRITATRLWERTGDYVFALGEVEAYVNHENKAVGSIVSALDSIESGRWAKTNLVDGFDSRKRLASSTNGNGAADAKQSVIERELQQLESEKIALIEKLLPPSAKEEGIEVDRRLAKINASLALLPRPQFVFAGANDFETAGSFHPAKEPRAVFLLKRGEVKQPIKPADPGALTCLPGMPARFNLNHPQDEGSRRAALAKWISDPANLLTRRSIVNRVWQYHFGRGIVETPNDFGHMGAVPSHPELLDWLAFWFLDHGESLKKLHRYLLTSSTYRQSVAENPAFAKIDADNKYLWRMNRSRLDAEEVRDAVVSIAGRLDSTMGGPSVQQFFFKDDHSPVYDYTRFDVATRQAFRRSIYRFVVRSVPDPFMETLDCPDPSLLAPKRDTTLTALQALALLNDPFILRQAELLADRLEKQGGSMEQQIEAAYQFALARPPGTDELDRLLSYTQSHGMVNLCRLIFNSNEFMFID